MKGKGAADLDNIPPLFLKLFSPLTLQELLSIFNSSFALAHCPHNWRVPTSIPLLIAATSPSEVASFCPINLTVSSLLYIAETNDLFSQFQASFCRGLSCEDQITQIVQEIEDGFQHAFVMTLLDFSKAYDTVWREKLLLHMLDTDIPSTFIGCIQSFFNKSLVPAVVLLKVYLKIPFLPHCSSCSTSPI